MSETTSTPSFPPDASVVGNGAGTSTMSSTSVSTSPLEPMPPSGVPIDADQESTLTFPASRIRESDVGGAPPVSISAPPARVSVEPRRASLLPSRYPPTADAARAVEGTLKRLRAEYAGSPDKSQKARLLTEIGELEERAGDEPGAARDYLAAFNTDPSFREPLESLVRLLERRRSHKNLVKVIDALVRAADTSDERARALLMRAAYLEDVAGDTDGAKNVAREATEVGAKAGESATAWLTLELIAARIGDADTRRHALVQRAALSTDPTWRGLLLVDAGRLAALTGETDVALSLLDEARTVGGGATYVASVELGRLAQKANAANGGSTDPEVIERARLAASALETEATLLGQAVATEGATDVTDHGVPSWLLGSHAAAPAADAWLRAAVEFRLAGDLPRAADVLDRALSFLATTDDATRASVEPYLFDARMRMADAAGETALSSALAERLLADATDAGERASLSLRIAEHAIATGDRDRAIDVLAGAAAADPGSLPVRAQQLDLLATRDAGAFAGQLEAFAEHLATDDARGRAYIVAGYVWGVLAHDGEAAKAALSQAALCGVEQSTVARIARMTASLVGDSAWYEEATRRLLASGSVDDEVVSLGLELTRARFARGDDEAGRKALRELGATPRGAWLGRAIEAFMMVPSGVAADADTTRAPSIAALDALAAVEPDTVLARGLALMATMRAQASGDADGARSRLRELASAEAGDPLVASWLSELERRADAPVAAGRIAAACAAATPDPELSAALYLEAGLVRWRQGDRRGAVEAFLEAQTASPEAASLALAWASRGVDVDSGDGRRRALDRGVAAGGDVAPLALERFAIDLADTDAAREALGVVDAEGDGALAVAAALARIVWPEGAMDSGAHALAIARIAGAGHDANILAASEQFRIARESGVVEDAVESARAWFDAGGGMAAGLEWLAAAMSMDSVAGEADARLAIAGLLDGDSRDALAASASSLRRAAAGTPASPATTPLLSGATAASRLANLDASPPGSDPRRRAAALTSLRATDFDGTLDASAEALPYDEATALAGWSYLAADDAQKALVCFEAAATAQPDDLAAWEGLRTAAELTGAVERHAGAASELGARCADDARGAAYWEEAAHLLVTLGDEELAEVAFEASFTRDASRAVAFDKLFRRVREKKESDRLLVLIARRLEVTDDPPEIAKLFWEQARVMRQKGDTDSALKALENVTMLEPDHVGALALTGEIFIRRGQFEEAADHLARLAAIESAPAKNRMTAGIAAVDLYENKLDRFDKALEVLRVLHGAQLSSLPVRERLARAAARTGSWSDATAILEELMHERAEPEGRVEAARLAMAIHRDRLGEPKAARAALHKLLDEAPMDGEGIDMLLSIEDDEAVRARYLLRAKTVLLEAVALKPHDVAAVRRLARVARALGEDDLQQAALSVSIALGGSDSASEQMFAQLSTRKPRAPQIALTEAFLQKLLAPGDDGPIADLFVLLGPTLAEALGPSLVACGVSKRDRIDPRSGIALRNEVASWTGAFGIREFDLYVGGKDPLGVQGVPGEVPSLVVGSGVNAPLAPITRARVARELFAMVRGTTVIRHRDETTVAAIVIAACRISEVPIEAPAYAMLADVERLLSKALPRKLKKPVADLCRLIAKSKLDARPWVKRVHISHGRVAAVASGDVGVVLADLLGEPMERIPQAARNDARAEAVLRFVLSPAYLELRRSLGLESTS